MNPTDPKVITFRPDPDSDYGTATCSWHEEPKGTVIAKDCIEKLAEGWKAEFKVEAAW